MLTLDEDRHHGLARGAFCLRHQTHHARRTRGRAYADQGLFGAAAKRLLVVEDNPAEQLSIRELLGYDDIDVTVVATGAGSARRVDERAIDCVVLDLRLPDMTGFRGAGAASAIPPRSTICRWWFSPARNSRRKKMPSCIRLARSVVVKGVESRSDCWMRPPSSCTA